MINSKQLDLMSRQGADEADPAQLTDINHVSIDTGLSATERMKAYLEQIKNPYCFRCGETVVRLCFAPAGNDLNSHLILWYNGRVVIGGLEEQCHALGNHRTNPL